MRFPSRLEEPCQHPALCWGSQEGTPGSSPSLLGHTGSETLFWGCAHTAWHEEGCVSQFSPVSPKLLQHTSPR